MNAVTPSLTPLGIGFYSIPEASRLLKLPARNIARWLGGYRFARGQAVTVMQPLWQPQLPHEDGHIELGFRDLIELRFVKAFLDEGLSILTIRRCLEFARTCVQESHPFSSRRFRTDGRTIFLDSATTEGGAVLLDLKRRQYAIKNIIDRTFRDLDIEAEAVVRWRPHKGRRDIVIDPMRSFGQPIAAAFGIPTVVLAEAAVAEGSAERAARLYEVPALVVREAIAFERSLSEA
jgi:uncharacterized protein (DUF433 family)